MSSLKQQQQVELKSLESDGLLKPEDVVNFAADPETALHKAFEWNDSKAAHAHRLWQARQLIVSVHIVDNRSPEPIQAWVSLKSDRTNPGGGYRDTVAVLSDAELRQQMLETFWDEYDRMRERYQRFEELAEIFKTGDKARPKRSRKKRETAGTK